MYRVSRLPTRFTPATIRTISMSAVRSAAGDTGSGASRPGGAAQGDAFSKREAASESKYIHDQEMARIKKLREELAKKQQDLQSLQKEVDEVEKKVKK